MCEIRNTVRREDRPSALRPNAPHFVQAQHTQIQFAVPLPVGFMSVKCLPAVAAAVSVSLPRSTPEKIRLNNVTVSACIHTPRDAAGVRHGVGAQHSGREYTLWCSNIGGGTCAPCVRCRATRRARLARRTRVDDVQQRGSDSSLLCMVENCMSIQNHTFST